MDPVAVAADEAVVGDSDRRGQSECQSDRDNERPLARAREDEEIKSRQGQQDVARIDHVADHDEKGQNGHDPCQQKEAPSFVISGPHNRFRNGPNEEKDTRACEQCIPKLCAG